MRPQPVCMHADCVAQLLAYGPMLAEHCVLRAGLSPTRKPAAEPLSDDEIAALMTQIEAFDRWLAECKDAAPKGYILLKEAPKATPDLRGAPGKKGAPADAVGASGADVGAGAGAGAASGQRAAADGASTGQVENDGPARAEGGAAAATAGASGATNGAASAIASGGSADKPGTPADGTGTAAAHATKAAEPNPAADNSDSDAGDNDASAAPADSKAQSARPECPEGWMYADFDPLLLEQKKGGRVLEFATFDAALDEFFSKVRTLGILWHAISAVDVARHLANFLPSSAWALHTPAKMWERDGL